MHLILHIKNQMQTKKWHPLVSFFSLVMSYAVILLIIASVIYFNHQKEVFYFVRALTKGLVLFPLIGIFISFFIAWFYPVWSRKKWYYYGVILSILLGYYIYVIVLNASGSGDHYIERFISFMFLVFPLLCLIMLFIFAIYYRTWTSRRWYIVVAFMILLLYYYLSSALDVVYWKWW